MTVLIYRVHALFMECDTAKVQRILNSNFMNGSKFLISGVTFILGTSLRRTPNYIIFTHASKQAVQLAVIPCVCVCVCVCMCMCVYVHVPISKLGNCGFLETVQ